MALRTRGKQFPVQCGIDTRQITNASRMVSQYTGIAVQPNKAVVGINAFAHESGIHQHGVLKHAETYEIMSPESIGMDSTDGRGSMILGKHSGKAAFRARLVQLGFDEIAKDPKRLEAIVQDAKALADKQKTIDDSDLATLCSGDGTQAFEGLFETWRLLDSTYMSSAQLVSNTSTCTATVTMSELSSGKSVVQAAAGVGPVDATFKAILAVVDRQVSLSHYVVTKIGAAPDPTTPATTPSPRWSHRSSPPSPRSTCPATSPAPSARRPTRSEKASPPPPRPSPTPASPPPPTLSSRRPTRTCLLSTACWATSNSSLRPAKSHEYSRGAGGDRQIEQ